MELNGASMGSRTAFSKTREIKGRVIGTAPIDRIVLVKNDEELETLDFLTSDPSQSDTLELNFWSDSDPVQRAFPRAWRLWKGTVQVEGVKMTKAWPPALLNPALEYVRLSGDNRVEFSLLTRGSERSILFKLSSRASLKNIHLKLESPSGSIQNFYNRLVTRYGKTLGMEHYPAELLFPAKDLTGREVFKKILPAGRYHDSVGVRYVNTNAAMDREFAFLDEEDAEPDDYYYVRIIQLDKGVIWSSPVWVGGFSPP